MNRGLRQIYLLGAIEAISALETLLVKVLLQRVKKTNIDAINASMNSQVTMVVQIRPAVPLRERLVLDERMCIHVLDIIPIDQARPVGEKDAFLSSSVKTMAYSDLSCTYPSSLQDGHEAHDADKFEVALRQESASTLE